MAHVARVLAEQHSVAATMKEIAGLAVEVVPGADAATMSSAQRRQQVPVVTAGPLADPCAALQRRLGEGPAVPGTARFGDRVLPVDLGTDRRWPRFSRQARALGVHGVLVRDLPAPGSAGTRLVVYTRAAFEPDAVRVAAIFTTHAAVALAAARRAEHLTAAVTTRQRIGQAVGLLMHRHLLTEQAAFDLLSAASQQLNVKLRDLAEIVVATGVEPDEAADLALRAAKEAAARADGLRQVRDGTAPAATGTDGTVTDDWQDEARQRAQRATARVVHRLAASAPRVGDGQRGT
jgi:hypothetical protein